MVEDVGTCSDQCFSVGANPCGDGYSCDEGSGSCVEDVPPVSEPCDLCYTTSAAISLLREQAAYYGELQIQHERWQILTTGSVGLLICLHVLAFMANQWRVRA